MNYQLETSTDLLSSKMQKSWIVVFSAATFFFYQFMLINMFSAFNIHLLREFNLSTTHLGHVSASYFYISIFSLIPAGVVLDRYSTKRVISIAIFGSTLSTFLFSFAPSPQFAMFVRCLAGISGAYCLLGPIRLATNWFPPQRLALVIGLIVSFAMFGGIVAQTPLTMLADAVGWRQACRLMSLLGMVFLTLIITFVRDKPSSQKTSYHAAQSLTEFLHSLKLTLLKPFNWIVGLYISLLNLPVYLLGAMWGTMYLDQAFNVNRTQSTHIISMIFVGMIFGSPTMGWLSDKLTHRKKPMLIFGLTSIMPFLVLLFAPSLSYVSLLAIFFCIGFLISIQVIGYPFIAENNSHEHVGTAEGLASTILIMGGFAQPLFGYLMQKGWNGQIVEGVPIYSAMNYQLAISIMPIAMVIAVILLLIVDEGEKLWKS